MMTIWKKLSRVFGAFGGDRAGNVMITFALATLPIVGFTGFAVDYSRANAVKASLQAALDTTALMLSKEANTDTSDQFRANAKKYFDALFNRPEATGATITASYTSSSSQVLVDGAVNIPTIFLGVIGINTMPVTAHSEAVAGGVNLEVALILDTTGSMAGQRIVDLRAAATDLVNLVVRDNQTPFYSKVALVPYSMAVNVGTYAAQIRGPIAAPKTITGATHANPVVITSTAHGFANGDYVYIAGVNGMSQINNQTFRVANKTADTFQLQNIDGRNYNHYSGGGSAYCTTQGCEYFRFTNALGAIRTFRVSTCVTERTGTDAYTDIAPSTALLGRNYPSTSNPCPSGSENVIVPLTSSRSTLTSRISQLEASGSTGGHIGAAWGWYLLSPNFGYLWPSGSGPAAYSAKNVLKVAVLMTDGEYNSSYCNGVISQDSTSGSGATSDHINCNAPNGSAFNQATTICTRMKQAGVTVYTVGFQVVNDQRARDLVNGCATNASQVYMAGNGSELRAAFTAIGQKITQLRISK